MVVVGGGCDRILKGIILQQLFALGHLFHLTYRVVIKISLRYRPRLLFVFLLS